MANVARINEIIDRRGLKRGFVADQIGMTQNSFINKMSGKVDFKVSEAQALCRVLGITDPYEKAAIFFEG